MTKAELIAAVAETAGLTKVQTCAALDGFTGAVSSALAKGDSVTVPGFGTFSVSERAARTGRNPSTGEALEIAASRAAKFKQGKQLKEQLNGG